MTDGRTIGDSLETVARAWMPRILTQMCRDPTSPIYGCADRNWWHYKIRDFPSIILQQAGYCVHLAGRLSHWDGDQAAIDRIAAASARFWNVRALKHGAFEEYYPWEQGYPPLAFATLAVAKMVDAGVVPLADVRAGLERAARQLRRRFEGKAANQQVAGLAALAWVDKLLPDGADAGAFAELKQRTLALQNVEGWFWEYDGPDLGYLSVTLDCLWDLYGATGDGDYREATRRALHFMAPAMGTLLAGFGQHNSRNTDYLVPYGIVRSALEGEGQERKDAATVGFLAFTAAGSSDHFFAATDDRYICHYIGHSVLRACLLLRDGADGWPLYRYSEYGAGRLYPESGHYLQDEQNDRQPGLAISCRKGGIVTAFLEGREASDFGWIVERGRGRQLVSHWWSPAWTFRHDQAVEISGPLFPHREKLSSPLKHMVLRVLSFVLGRRLIDVLKRTLIFKAKPSDVAFHRRISWTATTVEIVDRFDNLRAGDRLVRAPRASKRHVASADSFHREDLAPLGEAAIEEMREDDGAQVTIRTRMILQPN